MCAFEQSEKGRKFNMKNKVTSIIQSLLCCIIYVAVIYTIIMIFGGEYISEAISYIDLISTKESDIQNSKLEIGNNGLNHRPEYGMQYGKLTISSVNISLPVFFGNTLDILKDGIGQSTRSYCPRRR